MEYMPSGELFDYVLERHGLSESEAREMFQQIVEALEHCHKVRTNDMGYISMGKSSGFDGIRVFFQSGIMSRVHVWAGIVAVL